MTFASVDEILKFDHLRCKLLRTVLFPAFPMLLFMKMCKVVVASEPVD